MTSLYFAPTLDTLPNGIRVVTDTIPGAATVALGLYFSVGTRCEAEAEHGLAHLVEHMMFKGTPTRDAFEISRAIEAVGGQINAFTGREQTGYYAKVLAEDAPLVLDILSDMLRHSLLDKAELDREREVIVQEIGQVQDTPDDLVFDLLAERVWAGQALGRSVLGTAEAIRTMPHQALADYVQRFYVGSNLVVVGSGAISRDNLLAMVQQRLGTLAKGSTPATTPALYVGGEVVDARETEQLHLALAWPGAAAGASDYYAQSVLSTLLGGGMSSRLFQEVREKRGLVYSIYSFTQPLLDGGLFGLYAGLAAEKLAELVTVCIAEIAAVAQNITPEELVRAKAQLRAGMVMGLESNLGRAEALAQQLQVHGRLLSLADILAKLDAVTVLDCQREAAKLLKAKPSISLVGPKADASIILNGLALN